MYVFKISKNGEGTSQQENVSQHACDSESSNDDLPFDTRANDDSKSVFLKWSRTRGIRLNVKITINNF